jgi:hypothetical protein
MTDLELIFTMLGEASTTEIARHVDAQGFPSNRRTAKEGGNIAGNARTALEAKTGKSVISATNNLALDDVEINGVAVLPIQYARNSVRRLPRSNRGSASSRKK